MKKRSNAMHATLLLALGLPGCQSMHRPEWPQASFKDCSPAAEKGREKSGENACSTHEKGVYAYMMASKYCHDLSRFYETGGTMAGVTKGSVGVIGAISGAVLAPLASGTTAAALSGVSGAANAMQGAVESAVSGSLLLNKQQRLAKVVDTFGGIAADDSSQLQVQAITMMNQCWSAAGQGDAEMLRAILESSAGSEQRENRTPRTARPLIRTAKPDRTMGSLQGGGTAQPEE